MIPLPESPQPSLSPGVRWLAGAAALVLAAGVGIAVVQPGDLDDDDGGGTAAPITTSTTDAGGDGGDGTTTSSTPPGTTPESSTTTTSTTEPSSGLGTNGSGSAGEDDLADTGGAPLVLPGVALLAGAAISRRLAR